MKTLPDYLEPGLSVLSIGLNPSLPSVRAGFYFANPRNRFWSALNRSNWVNEALTPGVEAQKRLLDEYSIGFTDVVKRPTAGVSDLRAADYRRWAPVLHGKIVSNAPRLAWFHGKVAYRQYVRHAGIRLEALQWGLQSESIGDSVVYVTPNPSPANAAFSLPVLVDWFNKAHNLFCSLRRR